MAKKRGAGIRSKQRNQRLVFVSHASYDKWIATIICEKLESAEIGASTFRDDRDIDGGDSIPDAIMQAIRDCDEMIVLVTPQSVERHWVSMEIAMAAILGKHIVPILYHVTPETLNDLIRNKRAYSLNELSDYLMSVKRRMQNS